MVKAVGFTTLALGTVSLAAGFTGFLMAGATLGASLIAATLLAPITASLLMIALISSAVLMGVSVLQTATSEMGKTLGGSQLSTDQIKGRKLEGESNSLSAVALYMGASFNLILNGALDVGISNKQSQIDATIQQAVVIEQVNDVVNEGGLETSQKLLNVGTKSDAIAGVKNLPEAIQSKVKDFYRGGSNAYNNFGVEQLESGNYLVQMTKPGNVPGSYATYFKEITEVGETVITYKNTIDPFGNLVHTKIK